MCEQKHQKNKIGYDLVNRVLVHVTDACNLSCRHCYIASSKKSQIDPSNQPYLQRLLLEIDKPVDISGGEPFIYQGLHAFLQACAEKEIHISSIFTNATLAKRNLEIIRFLSNHYRELCFFVSLDGYRDSHDAFRGHGAYELAIDGASWLKEQGFRVFINTILHNRIALKDLDSLCAEIVNRSFDRWRVDTPFSTGNWAANRASFELDTSEAFQYFNHVLSLWLAEGESFELEVGHLAKYLNGQLYFLDRYSLTDAICPCRTLVIWPNGTITWCQNLTGPAFQIATVRDTPSEIYKAYLRYKERKICDVRSLIPKCRDCSLVEFCGTGCRASAILEGEGEIGIDHEMCSIYEDGLYKSIASHLLRTKGIRQ